MKSCGHIGVNSRRQATIQVPRLGLRPPGASGLATPSKSVTPKPSAALPNQFTVARTPLPTSAIDIVFRADPTIHDGRFANNAWLQELPKPLTKLTWDNAAMVSPRTAEQLGLSYSLASRGGEHGQIIADMVELNYQGRSLKLPAWILPGHADGCVTVHLGYGRTRAGKVGTGTGFNAYPLRTSAAPWSDPGLEIRKTGDQFRLACTQYHHNMEGREFVRSASLAEYVAQPDFAQRSAD